MMQDNRVAVGAWAAAVALSIGTVVAGCGGTSQDASAPPADQLAAAQPAVETAGQTAPPKELAGTEWRLVEFQSMDDATGTIRPSDPNLYTMRLGADGTVAMRLNCNRATGTWSAKAGADGASGQFTFGPLAATQALCPPPSMDERVTGQASYVRGYVIKDGRLHLSLMADGGIFTWEPVTDVPFETTPDRGIEAAILAASPDYTKATADIMGPSGRARYVYARVDLNGDGRDEVLAYPLGSVFCGTGGCNLLLLTQSDAGYRLVNEFPITRTPVIVSARKTNGWSDLYRPESGGGAEATWVRHTFDGGKYVERERTPGNERPAGKNCLAGELAFEKGIPLEPVK